jgi:hypothetical protein
MGINYDSRNLHTLYYTIKYHNQKTQNAFTTLTGYETTAGLFEYWRGITG